MPVTRRRATLSRCPGRTTLLHACPTPGPWPRSRGYARAPVLDRHSTSAPVYRPSSRGSGYAHDGRRCPAAGRALDELVGAGPTRAVRSAARRRCRPRIPCANSSGSIKASRSTSTISLLIPSTFERRPATVHASGLGDQRLLELADVRPAPSQRLYRQQPGCRSHAGLPATWCRRFRSSRRFTWSKGPVPRPGPCELQLCAPAPATSSRAGSRRRHRGQPPGGCASPPWGSGYVST